MATYFEVTGDDEAVAGVVAFAAEDYHGAVDANSLQHIDAAAAGVFHEHETGDAELLDRAAIDFARLGAGEGNTSHAVILPRIHTAGKCQRLVRGPLAPREEYVSRSETTTITTRTFRRRG